MEKRGTKVIALAALIVGVVALSIGFAAFSRNLTISSSASYTATNTDLTVNFSTAATATTAGTITPSVVGATGEPITLVSSSSNIASATGLKANFTAPGQSVTYSFYVRNDSDYTAYLTGITMANAAGGSTNIACTAGTSTDATMVNNACGDISVTVKSGTTTLYSTTGTSATNSIAANSGSEISVTIAYGDGHVAPDGNFDVAIGTLTLAYSSQA